jgi:hypothetical protein
MDSSYAKTHFKMHKTDILQGIQEHEIISWHVRVKLYVCAMISNEFAHGWHFPCAFWFVLNVCFTGSWRPGADLPWGGGGGGGGGGGPKSPESPQKNLLDHTFSAFRIAISGTLTIYSRSVWNFQDTKTWFWIPNCEWLSVLCYSNCPVTHTW